MANGEHRITEKPQLDSINEADEFVVLQDGKVRRAPVQAIGDIGITDKDDNDQRYFGSFTIKNGHFALSLQKKEGAEL